MTVCYFSCHSTTPSSPFNFLLNLVMMNMAKVMTMNTVMVVMVIMVKVVMMMMVLDGDDDGSKEAVC